MIANSLEWNDGLSTGVEDLDHAHMELVDLCKRIDWACSNDATVFDVRERIRTFLIYARWHFAEEEAWMRTIHYPGFVEHHADHARLLQDAADFVASFGPALGQKDGSAVASYFRFWLNRHMNERNTSLRVFICSTA